MTLRIRGFRRRRRPFRPGPSLYQRQRPASKDHVAAPLFSGAAVRKGQSPIAVEKGQIRPVRACVPMPLNSEPCELAAQPANNVPHAFLIERARTAFEKGRRPRFQLEDPTQPVRPIIRPPSEPGIGTPPAKESAAYLGSLRFAVKRTSGGAKVLARLACRLAQVRGCYGQLEAAHLAAAAFVVRTSHGIALAPSRRSQPSLKVRASTGAARPQCREAP